MNPQNSVQRGSEVPRSNGPHLQEFHPNVTDDVTLLNYTPVSFCDFDSINLAFHSCFLAHLDYGWSNHNNIFSR